MLVFPHNTLRLHQASLERQGFIVKVKKPMKMVEGLFSYSLSPEIRYQVVLTLKEPQTTVVSLTFQGGEASLQVREIESENC